MWVARLAIPEETLSGYTRAFEIESSAKGDFSGFFACQSVR
jgi:hypothetical protein